MPKRPMTVKELSDLLQKISGAGYGNMTFCIGEDPIYNDDYVVDYPNNRFSIRGILYNMKDYGKFKKFKQAVDKAWEELHGTQ